MYYPCSENKVADQLHSYWEADLRLCFRIDENLVFSLLFLVDWPKESGLEGGQPH